MGIWTHDSPILPGQFTYGASAVCQSQYRQCSACCFTSWRIRGWFCPVILSDNYMFLIISFTKTTTLVWVPETAENRQQMNTEYYCFQQWVIGSGKPWEGDLGNEKRGERGLRFPLVKYLEGMFMTASPGRWMLRLIRKISPAPPMFICQTILWSYREGDLQRLMRLSFWSQWEEQ